MVALTCCRRRTKRIALRRRWLHAKRAKRSAVVVARRRIVKRQQVDLLCGRRGFSAASTIASGRRLRTVGPQRNKKKSERRPPLVWLRSHGDASGSNKSLPALATAALAPAVYCPVPLRRRAAAPPPPLRTPPTRTPARAPDGVKNLRACVRVSDTLAGWLAAQRTGRAALAQSSRCPG